MDETQQRFTRNVLHSAAIYFAACGVSAIVYPKSWLFASGIPGDISRELGLAFGALGAYLLALAFGAFISALNPSRHGGVILTLIVGNALDFCVTLKAVVARHLPILNGGLFLVITIAWTVLLALCLANVRRSGGEVTPHR